MIFNNSNINASHIDIPQKGFSWALFQIRLLFWVKIISWGLLTSLPEFCALLFITAWLAGQIVWASRLCRNMKKASDLTWRLFHQTTFQAPPNQYSSSPVVSSQKVVVCSRCQVEINGGCEAVVSFTRCFFRDFSKSRNFEFRRRFWLS